MRNIPPALDGELRRRVRAREVLYGTFVSLGSPLATEACAIAGFDWLLVDLEHGGGSEATLLGQLHAAAARGTPCLVRVESAERIRAGRVLDLGAAGVMIPRLSSVEETRAALANLAYQPTGARGVATYNRVCDFGLRPAALDDAAEALLAVVQVENTRLLGCVAEVAQLPGVDCLFIGPRDLSHDLGCPGRTDDPAFQDAITRVVAAARDAGKAAGILAGSPEEAARYRDAGFTFVGIGSDSSFLVRAARSALVAVGGGR